VSAPQFSAAEVHEIRWQHSRGKLDIRVWADVKKCSIETVRRIARGDTYRHIGGQATHGSFGGLRGEAPAGRAEPAEAAFIPHEVAPLADLPGLADEPDHDEAAASLARLQAALAEPSADEVQASRAASLLDELEAKAAADRPQAGKGPSELG
jgi:hypothetical protein